MNDTNWFETPVPIWVFFVLLLVVVVLGTVWLVVVNDDRKHERVFDTIKRCCDQIASKFKQVRTTAVIFGILLTIITLTLLHSDKIFEDKEKIPDAFWIAFGVVLSAFATAITKLVEPDDNSQVEEDEGEITRDVDEIASTLQSLGEATESLQQGMRSLREEIRGPNGEEAPADVDDEARA